MINANVKKFKELLASDRAIVADLDNILVEATAKFACSKGLSFTAAEYMDSQMELTSEELDNVAGGIGNVTSGTVGGNVKITDNSGAVIDNSDRHIETKATTTNLTNKVCAFVGV